jgi:hypothetical protein
MLEPGHDLREIQPNEKVLPRHLFTPECVDDAVMMNNGRKLHGMGYEVWVHKHSYSESCADEFGCVHLTHSE